MEENEVLRLLKELEELEELRLYREWYEDVSRPSDIIRKFKKLRDG